VRNPLRSEAEAYRFLLLTVAYFGVIALAAWLGGRWVGLGIFVALSAAAAVLALRPEERPDPVPTTSIHRGGEDDHRILVVANETVGGETLRRELERRSQGKSTQVLVVCPALNSPLRHWASDEDGARAAAQVRLEASLARLREAGIEAQGEVGDGDPLQAIEDGLRTFGADEVVISTHPEGRSHWLARGIVSTARTRFAVPITHVVVDLEAEREDVR